MFRLSRLTRIVSPNSRFYSVSTKDIEKIRNIGILAHIDAGKTTTTERMLYYSGRINQMGEVHHGNTVTDYMDQERERGITITSAAVTFPWKKYNFNLIDTPGHIDFTMEVEQTLNVLDGAVVILDASAGVEAQTLTVWRQADKYKIPRLIYLNKMDRLDANVEACCKSIEKKLEAPYVLLQLPYVENKKLVGVVDVLSLSLVTFGSDKDKELKRIQLTEKEHMKLWTEAQESRRNVIDTLTSFDDDLANTVIEDNSLDNISTDDVVKAIRKTTISGSIAPILLGSSYKNIGVQTLMDSVILYLPSPKDVNQHFSNFEENLCARAFKVIHDRQRGPLVFARIYNGSIMKNQRIFNIKQDLSEQTSRIYIPYADEFKEVDSVDNGNIVVLAGLKKVQSGDLITTTNTACQRAKKKMQKSANTFDEEDIEKLFGPSAKPPPPVFFCSIEPPSMASQSALDAALQELQREDPSLRVIQNAETGQTVLAGMGELHLEIIKVRILKEYKIDAFLGPLQIAYRESPVKQVTDVNVVETKIANNKQMISVKLSLIPVHDGEVTNVIKFDKSPESASNIAGIFPKHMLAIKQGIEVGLSHGPKINAPVVNTEVMLHMFESGRGTSVSMIAATVTQLVQKLLRESDSDILEPIMNLEIVLPDEYVSTILADLSKRRTAINNVSLRGNHKLINAECPLSELKGYSTILRTLSSGTATFTMEFCKYQTMTPMDEEKAIREVRGF